MTKIKDRAASIFFRQRYRFKDKSRITESMFRLGEMYFHSNLFNRWPLETIFNTIYYSDFWQRDESKSGIGSSVESTAVMRNVLPEIIREYSIKSILDVPCGDYNWMKTLNMTIDYIGGDIVEELVNTNNQNYGNDKVRFIHLDITSSNLPKVDLIFCRDCLQHFSYDNIFKTLNNFKISGAKYILVTSYPYTLKNWNIGDGNYFPLNLRKGPFKLPKPMKIIKENAPKNEIDKSMLLYRIDDILISK